MKRVVLSCTYIGETRVYPGKIHKGEIYAAFRDKTYTTQSATSNMSQEQEIESFDLSFQKELIEEVVEEFGQPTVRGNVRDAMQAGVHHSQTDETEERMMKIIQGLVTIIVLLIDGD